LKSKKVELAQAEAYLDQLGNAANEALWPQYVKHCKARDRQRAEVPALEAGLRKAQSKEQAALAKSKRGHFVRSDVWIQQAHDRLAKKSPQWAVELAEVRALRAEVQASKSELEKQRNQLLKPSLM
jgi:hypothetical protein